MNNIEKIAKATSEVKRRAKNTAIGAGIGSIAGAVANHASELVTHGKTKFPSKTSLHGALIGAGLIGAVGALRSKRKGE
jgi:hypothetical protein